MRAHTHVTSGGIGHEAPWHYVSRKGRNTILRNVFYSAFPACSRTERPTGHVKAVWPEISRQIFQGFSAEAEPPRSQWPPRTSISTKNQPRGPMLRPNGDERKIPPDCLQAPKPRIVFIAFLGPRIEGPGSIFERSSNILRAFPADSRTERPTGYLKAVWPEIFRQVFPGFSAEADPRDPPGSQGPAQHINFHARISPADRCSSQMVTNEKSRQTAFKYPTLGLFLLPSWGPGEKVRGLSSSDLRTFFGHSRPGLLSDREAHWVPEGNLATDFQPNPKPPSAKPASGNRRNN